ncbi:MAG: CotH kinase family protein [Spirosomaceae bacterium]|jgi:hypothetical protein|nr:CotH kinase family protein [Spirosomataceae bacterium]
MKRLISTSTIAFCAATCIYLQSFAQNFPKEFYLSADKHILHIGGQPSTGFYDETKVQQVNLQFSQPNYWTQLTNNYASKTDLAATMTVNGVKYESVGVRFKGQTSYQGTRNSDKKSFNVSTDFIKTDQKVAGYKTFNLNNSYQDPSFMREVFYYHQIRRHTPAAKASYLHLYINGQDWGVYQSVQQLNKDFLKEWFLTNDGSNWRCEPPTSTTGGGMMGGGFGNGTSALNYFDDDTTTYKKYYTLKSSDQKLPWKDLPTVCKLLNKTEIPMLEEAVSQYLDIDRTLWHIASEILFSDDDSYINKGGMDYYLYQDAETGRFMTMDYDGNSVMSANLATWSPFFNETRVNFPILNRLLAAPTVRQRYLAHLRTLINETFDEKTAFPLIDKYAAFVDSLVQKDPKKLSTYAQFQAEIPRLKTFITNRRNFLLNHAEVKEAGPTLSETAHYVGNTKWQNPTADQAVTVRTKAASATGVSRATLYYGTGYYGRFTKTELFDDGKHDDGAANDGVYAAQIPKQNMGAWVRYYVEFAANNTAKSITYAPAGAEHDVYVYQVSGTGDPGNPTPPPVITSVENEVVVALTVAPNPATHTVRIKAEGMSEAPILIHNLTGQRVFETAFQPSVTLSVENWAKGLYLVRCGNVTQKLLLQ